MYKNGIKPLFDFFAAFLGLLLLSPFFIFILLFLSVANNGKPFFLQPRPGKNGKTFHIIKFKTMNDKRAADGSLLPDRDRLTKIGSIVRKTSLDEIPQLINIVMGDMSLVGPRPLLIKYLPFYTERENLRHTVKPGLTGWAQINGRNNLNWNSRLEHDIYYVENISVKFDIQIILRTIKKVLKSENVVVDPTLIFKDLKEERELIFKELEKPCQLETIIELHKLILKGTILEKKNIYFDQNFKPFLSKVIGMPHNHFFVVEINSVVKGFAHFKIIDEVIFLNNIAINEDLNNIGLGKKLLQYSCSKLINLYTQAETLKLDVFKSNDKAYNWYKKIGFEEENRLDWFQLYSKSNNSESHNFKIDSDPSGFLSYFDGEIKFGTIVNNNIILHKSDYIYRINSNYFDSVLTNDNSFIYNSKQNLVLYHSIDSAIRMKISLKKLNQNFFNGKQN